MELKSEEVSQWKAELVTSEVLRRVQKELEECSLLVCDGATMRDNPLLTVQETADAVGYIRGLRFILDFKGDDKEQEINPT